MAKIKYEDVKLLIDNFQDLHKSVYYTLSKKTADFDVSIAQIRLLTIVHKCNNINQNELAKKLNVSKATLSVRIQRLEKLGYLAKLQDPNDKRYYILKVTARGEKFIEEGHRIMKDKVMHLFNGISKEQIEILNSVIKIMKMNIEECKGDK